MYMYVYIYIGLTLPPPPQVDPALLRPGRMEVHVKIGEPIYVCICVSRTPDSC